MLRLKMRKITKGFRKRILALSFGLLLALIIPELVIRFGPWDAPSGVTAAIDLRDNSWTVPHELLGYVPAVDADQTLITFDYSSFHLRTSPTAIDGVGFRGTYDGSRPCTLLVGDSFAMSAGVEEADTLAVQLSKETGQSVLNFGVSGYGPQQTGLRLFDHGLAYQPETVIWTFFGNDFTDAVALEHWVDKGRPAPGAESSRLRAWRNTYWATYKLYRHLSGYHSSRREHWQQGETEYLFTYDLENELDLKSETIQDGMEVLRRELLRFATGAETQGYRPVLVLFPFKEQTYEPEFRAVARRDTTGMELHAAYAAVTELGAELGIYTLDLTEALREARQQQLYFVTDPHLTAAGNRVAARAIAEFLEECERSSIGDKSSSRDEGSPRPRTRKDTLEPSEK